jgi:hypothetical protein
MAAEIPYEKHKDTRCLHRSAETRESSLGRALSPKDSVVHTNKSTDRIYDGPHTILAVGRPYKTEGCGFLLVFQKRPHHRLPGANIANQRIYEWFNFRPSFGNASEILAAIPSRGRLF